MKKPVLFNPFFAILLLVSITTGEYGRADSLTSGEKREVASYRQLVLEGAFSVTLVQGSEESVFIEAAPELSEQIITKSEVETLRIHSKRKTSSSGKIRITVNFKNLRNIECPGAIVINGSGAMKFEGLSLDVSRACNTTMDLTASRLEVDISGAGNTSLKGKASGVELDISGSGTFMASELLADEYHIEISGSGSAEVYAAKLLDVEVSGSGNIKYRGDPKISTEISGTGRITKM